MRKKKVLNKNSEEKTEEEINKIIEKHNKTKEIDNPKNLFFSDFFKSMFKTFGYTLLGFMGLLFILFLFMWLT